MTHLTTARIALVLCGIYLLRLLYRILYPFFIARLLPNSALKKLRRRGEWAVITGATDGIGKAFACALAKRGFNICLLSRSPVKLDAVADEIRRCHGVEVMIHPIDFRTGDLSPAGPYGKITNLINGIEVSVLVNNVGASPGWKHFHTIGSSQDDIQMTKLCLPGMVGRNGGLVVNLASVLGTVPSQPMLALYAAMKHSLVQFSTGIQAEYKNVEVLCLTPGFVVTKMTAGIVDKPSFFAPLPEAYVESALNTVGLRLGVTTGYFAHELENAYERAQMELTSLIPDLAYSLLSRTLRRARASRSL